MMTDAEYRVLERVDALSDEMTAFLQALIRIPTVNPPGEAYDPCARAIGRVLEGLGFQVEYIIAADHPDHAPVYPRVNVMGRLPGRHGMPALHLNGHMDVVPPGEGWTVDPFGGEVRDGRMYGRGACDMKSGIAAAVFAAAALREAGATLGGALEISATVDEESGGFAGMAYLAAQGRIAAGRTSYVIIPEPLNVDRICLGHRGVYWFQIDAAGRIAHGSMPFLGSNAVDMMGRVLHRIDTVLRPALNARTTAIRVEPPEARRATLNINGIFGGQTRAGVGTPCVADRCTAIFDRRFLKEERFEDVRDEIERLLEGLRAEHPAFHATLTDLMVVHPVETAAETDLVQTTARTIRDVLRTDPELIASPGTYDHKHVFNIGRVDQCIAYGPGLLHLAHQPDEYCEIAHLVQSCKVIALTAMRLLGGIIYASQ
jgi:succinyl-diaminopimelate desuccinylase